ncbi:MAG TPA: nuclear transport factor 2 family protein, partial [Burkholderiales bacterium]|nr:nuclear transport factor 2 family protein [Burkholderiales bacterium]
RSYDRFVRAAGAWRIERREMIYEKDRLDPVDPAARMVLDQAALARYPGGYRHLAYLQAAGGARITPELPVPGSEALARLYAEGESWLRA